MIIYYNSKIPDKLNKTIDNEFEDEIKEVNFMDNAELDDKAEELDLDLDLDSDSDDFTLRLKKFNIKRRINKLKNNVKKVLTKLIPSLRRTKKPKSKISKIINRRIQHAKSTAKKNSSSPGKSASSLASNRRRKGRTNPL